MSHYISNDTLTDRIGQERGRMIYELPIINRGKCISQRWCRNTQSLIGKTTIENIVSPEKTICCIHCSSHLAVSFWQKEWRRVSLFQGRWVSASDISNNG